MTDKMDPALKAKWLELLRSDYYQDRQGQGRFITYRDGVECFCPLAILCIAANQPIRIPENGMKSDNYSFVKSVLPKDIYERIWMYNDDCDAQPSLNAVADWIEANVP